MKFDELSPELKEKIKACKTKEDLDAVLNTHGAELTEEQLEVLSGGVQRMCFGLDNCELYVWNE